MVDSPSPVPEMLTVPSADKRMPWGREGDETGEVVEELERHGKR